MCSSLQIQDTHIKTWLLSWFSDRDDYSEKLVSALMITAWFIWKNQCLKEFNNKHQNIPSTVFSIKHMLNQCSSSKQHSTESQITYWSPPQRDMLKINMDASFDSNHLYAGISLIIRDSAGNCQGIRGRFIHGGVDLENPECLALKESIIWAREKNLTKVMFEGDCVNMVNCVTQAKSSVRWGNEAIVNEIRQLFSWFSWFNVSYVKRQANKVAHVIANKARTDITSFDYHYSIPENFMVEIRNDQSHISQCNM
ncbi:uncharacterized protein LOC113313018 [Papaver somniferum]|uniref:uncharacterized protein LOC113313018 n=1 Tax=Papaver somniferum TaxID=3469 RepID=UPI000E70368B|nr:uncharacterized protein LOC113313018 [Papaver somniferum]